MHSYRISKFDPAASADQRREEWTSIADIGRRFSGEILTRSAYEEAESKYLEALRLLLSEGQVRLLRVKDVLRSSVATAASSWIADGITLDVQEALEVCRAQLREELSCHLVADTGYCIDVGFDFYLYVTSPIALHRSLDAIRDFGLYVETGVPSPYFEQ